MDQIYIKNKLKGCLENIKVHAQKLKKKKFINTKLNVQTPLVPFKNRRATKIIQMTP
jgi:hypothetical protein